MRTKQSRLVEFAYRTGRSTLNLARADVLESLERAGFQLAGPPSVLSYEVPFQSIPPLPGRLELLDYCGVGLAAPSQVYALGPAATRRFLEFFTVHITNSHTRRAYAAAVGDFLLWCEAKSIQSLELVRERQIREYVSDLTQAQRISSVKQRLAALRHLFNWLANGRIMPNPATFVRIENTSYLPNSRMD